MTAETDPPLWGLEDLRRRVAAVLRGLEHPPLGMAAALAEECGETSRLLLEQHAYGADPDPEGLGDELADVLICLCEIATAHGVDLDAAMARKLSAVAAKAPGWRDTLGEALRRAREGS